MGVCDERGNPEYMPEAEGGSGRDAGAAVRVRDVGRLQSFVGLESDACWQICQHFGFILFRAVAVFDQIFLRFPP
jgi:hypothetical protein